MAKGRGLNKGRGLGALIPRAAERAAEPEITESVAAKPKAAEPDSTESTAIQSEITKPAAAKPKSAAPKTTQSAAPEVKSAEPKTTQSAAPEVKAAASETTQSAAPEVKNTETDTAKSGAAAVDEEVLSVRITEVVPNREQPRKRFDEEAIEKLAASIREHGIVTPLIVRKKGKYYELIAGERRWRAAKLAGLKKVPVLLRTFSEEQAAEIALIENIQRENLNAMEEALAFRRLQEEYNLKQEDIAKRVSRSRSAITNSLRLLKLEENVQTMLAEGTLSMGHARALLALENPEMQRVTAERVLEKDLSVRETEKLVRSLLSPKKAANPKTEDAQISAIYRDIEEQLRKSMGTRVSIQPIKGKKGKIEIEYYSDEDLERIIAQLRQN